MSVRRRRLRGIAFFASAAVLVLGAAACGSEESAGTDEQADDQTGEAVPADTDDQITLVLQTFGDFGYDAAIEQFQAANPNITVDHQVMGELRDFQPRLVQWLATGSGAGDVVGLEEGVLLGYIEDHEAFVNLFDYGGEELAETYVPWKWERGITPDGSKLVGLGTDVGGLAMCYRSDLFEAAGLPTDRDEVSALWSTWEEYVEAGAQFQASSDGAAWLDSATSIMQPYVMQSSGVFLYDEDGAFIGASNPVVREAWDLGLDMADDGLTAKLVKWTAEWDAGFRNSEFATMPCPSWMTGVIAERAGEEHAGHWDVATIPGGTGNWGGSYLAVPEQTEHPQEAYELAKFLTSPEGHLAAYEEVGAMPSSVAALEDPAFVNSTNEYFNDAPTGQIFSDSVIDMRPVHLGANHQQTWENIFEPQMQAAEQGQATPDEAFSTAVSEAQAL